MPLALAAVLVGVLVSPVPGVRRTPAHHLLVVGIGALGGGLAGVLITWLLGDVWNVFGISLTAVIRWADAVAFAALGIAVVNSVRTRWPRKVLGAGSAVLTLVCLALVINVDFGQYPRLGDALGITYTKQAGLQPVRGNPVDLASWVPPADLPAHGVVGRVDIPATASGFPARSAYVYLPPAAREPNPPALPVVVALSGQPGGPADLFRAAGLDVILDRLAAEHSGVAPIVVVPDQLGDPTSNPMCIDGPLGNAETYLTVDVPDWIRSHLAVAQDRSGWTIAGFSQGGTCAVQLGAGHPELFGSILGISGEDAPTLGSVAATIERGFGGDAAAYRASTAAGLLSAGAPYADTVAVFVAGQHDARYCASMRTVSAEAAEAGMAVTSLVSPGTAHDWNTARYGLRTGFTRLLPRWGIDG